MHNYHSQITDEELVLEGLLSKTAQSFSTLNYVILSPIMLNVFHLLKVDWNVTQVKYKDITI